MFGWCPDALAQAAWRRHEAAGVQNQMTAAWLSCDSQGTDQTSPASQIAHECGLLVLIPYVMPGSTIAFKHVLSYNCLLQTFLSC
jgi:hypothetical protein